MGIKDLFEKSSTGVITSTSLEEEIVANNPELESTENIEEQRKRIDRFIPHVDFSNPENFARYGSAESYYKDGIARIYNQYPYDGSEREIQEFLNESNPIDLYIFENKYPRTTGYAVLAVDGWGTQTSTVGGFGKPSLAEYISFKGGPHTSSGGVGTGSLASSFGEPTYRTSPNANIYDADIYGTAEVDALGRAASRESNLKFKLADGVTTEFFLRKGDWITNLTHKEVIFDLWNGQNTSSVTDESYAENKGYGRLLIYLTGSGNASGDDLGPGGTNPFRVHLASGSSVWDMSFGGTTTTTASLSGTWNHVAFSFLTSSTDKQLEAKFYLNGKIQETQLNTSLASFGEVTGSLIGFIGALQTQPSGNSFDATIAGSMVGDGKLSGSLDEFRYWKTKRTEKNIQNNWWTQVRGGTNTDISNSDLGVYFKFNEGTTGTSSVDQTVLDYSGRISNGYWTGYPSLNARNLGSAIDSSSATVLGTTEFKDPIIYSEHSDVAALHRTYGDSGSAHDHSNVSSLMDSMPSWIVEEDDSSSGDLKKLTQIIGSYFDTLHLQIEHLPRIADVNYPSASFKPLPFSEKLLSSFGLHAPETFVEASILERFANRKDDRGYELDINDVKNQIYQNIYNNLSFIYKSKGTEKSFRNLIRCYGIDEEVIKLNAYGNNSTFKFEDTHYDATVRKNYIDFNHPDRFDGVVYQRPSNNSETTAISYISGTNANFANTAEVEIIFPRKMEFSNPQYFITPFVSCSLFGAHTPSASAGNFVWPVGSDDYGFQLYFIKTAEESKDGKFLLTTRTGDFTLTSSVYANVYDNQKWNFAIRTKDGKYPYAAGITGSISNTANLTSSAVDSTNVTVEFVGYNVDLGVTRNEFFLTASGLSDQYLTEARRYYAGANRTNTTGAVATRTDVRASSIRHYAHYLENAAIIAHAKDPDNYGVQFPNKNAIFATNDATIDIDNSDLPEAASLALNWDFAQITGSDSSGEFIVEDASSGSVLLYTRYSNDGNFSHIVANQYAGRGYFPSALSNSSVVDKNYVPAAKQRLPEVVNSGDAVNVLRQDDDLYPSDPAVSQTFFAFEKSMYGVVSQEMINTFATIIEFNNLVGEVTNKYRDGYKDFNRLKTLFFEKIENNPDLDKFIDYYKWIDNSLSVMIQQLVPASADVADEIRNVVEGHIMERNKYRHKFPLLDYKGNSRWGGDEALLEARLFGINELTYDWEHGHAPIATQATATVTVADGDAVSGMTEKEFLFMTSTDLTTITYMIVDDNTTTVATGDALTTTSDTGTGDAGTHATAVDCIDITGTEASSADVSFTILITTAAGGEHDSTAVTILLDDSATTDPAQTANTIAIGTAGISDAAKAAALIDAINGVSSSLVDLADSGVGQAGVQGVTAAEGTSDTEITLTMDAAGVAGNLTNAITTASGVNVVDVRSFTAGAEVQANTVAVAIGIATATAATAVNCIDLTGVEAAEADCSFTILIPTSAGGLGGDAITFLLDDSATTDSAEGENIIAIGTAGISDAAKAAKLILAINAATDGLIDYASSGNGQAGYNIGVTAAEGSSDTQITLTNDTANFAGNLTDAITTASGVNVVDVRSFTGGLTADTQNAFLVQLKAAIESANGHNDKILVSAVPVQADGAQAITLTQAQGGYAGNTSAVTTNTGLADGISQTTITLFAGGDDKERTNALWWKERAERNIQGFDLVESIDTARQAISDVILSFNSASYKGRFSTTDGTSYNGSAYALRRFASPVRMSIDLGGSDKVIKSGHNFQRGQKPSAIASLIQPFSSDEIKIDTETFKGINAEETGPAIATVKRKFATKATSPLGDATTGTDLRFKHLSPVSQYSSSLGTKEISGLHADSYGDNYETPMQGPFTEQHVGGYFHRHVRLNRARTRGDEDASVKIDNVDYRPEAWELTGSPRNTFTTRSSAHQPQAYANYQRNVKTKRPVNIRNIKMTSSSPYVSMTGTVGLHPGTVIGNYRSTWEIVQTSGRSANNSTLVSSGGYGSVSSVSVFVDSANDYAKPDRGRTEHVFVNRFSAPGGPETAGDSDGGPFLDLESAEYSPYNNLNYRNLSVRIPLQTLLTERSERFGLRSGSSVSSTVYSGLNVTASFHKINRNQIRRFKETENVASRGVASNSTLITASMADNYYVQHPIPQSDYQYTWITASHIPVSSDTFGYFPADGLVDRGVRAEATLSVDDGDENNSFSELEKITITATDGTSMTFTICDQNQSDITAGTVMEEGSDYGSDVLGSGATQIGTIALPVHLTGVLGKKNSFFNVLKTAMTFTHTLKAKVQMSLNESDVDGVQTRTLNQVDAGFAGNTTITTDIDSLTVTNFTGGRDKRLVSAFSAVSASDFISTQAGESGRLAFGLDKHSVETEVDPLWTDFAGMNTNVIDLINPRNFLLTGTNHGSTMNLSPLIAVPTTDGPAALLNATLLHRNGPYGHPTFKQIRVGQSLLGRHYRNRNIYTNTLITGEAFSSKIAALTETITPRRGHTIATTQSVVTKRFHPVKQEIVVMTGEGRNKQIPRTMMVQSSYGNNIAYFDDPTFASKLGIKINKGYSAYDTVKKLYLNGGVEDPSSPVTRVNRVLYSETVWPSYQNAYTEKIRGRTGYTNNFWKDKESDRIELASNTKKYFATLRLSQSSWPLDGYENFVSNTTVTNLLSGTSGHGKGSEHNVEYKAGILQNQFTHVHLGDASASWAGPLYARKHMFPTTASVCPAWGMVDHSSLENMEGLLATHTDNTTFWPDTPDSKQWLPAESLFRGEALWEANLHAGRFDATSGSFITSSVNPFKDSYDEWFSDIKAKGQDYSIIPEFRITDHLDFYSTLGNDYTTENESMLSIVGASTSSVYPQNSSEENFFTIFTNSDFMKHFEVIRNDHRNVLEPKAISLQCKAIKKFIAYDGFYPAERTVALTEQFINSYGEYVQYQQGTQGLEQNQYVRNFIKPLFSPGILFNTIKSGLAVDYPIMQDSSFLKFKSVDLTDDDTYSHDSYLGKATSGSFAIFGNSVSTVTGDWHQGWDKRIPFEALIEPEKYLAGESIADDEPSDQASIDAVVKWSGEGDSKYKHMAHNFLAECANFFLKGGKTTGLSSAPESEFKNVTPGQIYGMRIKLWRSMKKPKVTGSWGSFYVPQNTIEPRLGFGRTPGAFGGLTTKQNKETFTMYSRPSAFGPPLGLQVSSTSSLSGSEYDFGPRNGIYGSHTPPYYDGESWVDLIYFPVGLEAITRDGGADQGGTDSAAGKAMDIFSLTSGTLESSHDSYQPALSEIFNLNDGAVFETSASNVALNGTFMRKWRYDQEELRRNEALGHGGDGLAPYPFESGTYGKTGNPSIGKYAGLYGPAAGPWMNIWAMHGDASLNMFDKIQVSDGTKWRIQTKFETPMLNFNQVSVANKTLTLPAEPSASAAVPRGMWHQFGRMPRSDEGVYMQITDIPLDWLTNHPSASVVHDMAAKYRTSEKSPRIDGEQHVTDFYKGYSVPVGTHDSLTSAGATTITNPGISSLVDVCGFSTDPVRIGQIASKKIMKEAIVAVPFTIEDGDRKFFTVTNPLSEDYETLSGPSVKKQVRLMGEYVFPPSLDFVRNAELPAVAMYIFEFKHAFDADDLSHMWQNLPPRLGNSPQETDVSISHRLVADEIMGNYKELEDRIVRTNTDSVGAENFITPIDDEIRWMVFKVKQKAKTNYYDALTGKAVEKAAVEIPDYTHNWPYDFCSLVELAKLDVEIELGRPEDEGISGSPILKGQAPQLVPPGSTLSAAAAGGAIIQGSIDNSESSREGASAGSATISSGPGMGAVVGGQETTGAEQFAKDFGETMVPDLATAQGQYGVDSDTDEFSADDDGNEYQ